MAVPDVSLGLPVTSEEDEPLREALKRVKPVLCRRLPIEFLPTVLESERVISGTECKIIKEERSSVDKSLKLLELIEKKSIPVIRRFLEILKSHADFCGYGYLADKVYSESDAVVKEKEATIAVATTKATPSTKRAPRHPPYTLSRTRKSIGVRQKRRSPSPKVVYVPIFTELETKFALLAAATSEVIRKLDHHSFGNLLYFLRHLPQVDDGIFPSCSEPLSVQDLLTVLEESWNFANFQLADAIAQFFSDCHGNNSLADRVDCYKEALQKDLPVALADCKKKRVRPRALKRRSLLALVSPEEQEGFYLQQILMCRHFLVHKLGIKAALFVGFDEGGSIRVFFSIPRPIMWHLVPILQTQLSVLCELGITQVQIIGQFVIETGSGKLTYWDQDVVSGAGASALWKRKMKAKMQEMECEVKDKLNHIGEKLDSMTFQLAENAAELDQLRQERMSLQLKLQAAHAERDSLKEKLEVVGKSFALQAVGDAVEPQPPPPPPLSTEEEEHDPDEDFILPGQEESRIGGQVVEILDCLERLELITPEESVTLAKLMLSNNWEDSLLCVLGQKPLGVIDAARSALATYQDTDSITLALKCYSLLYQKGLLQADDLSSAVSTDVSSWTERLFLVQVSKSPDALEATADVCVEATVPLDVISWFRIVASLLKEGIIKNASRSEYCTISFRKIIFQQLDKSWTLVNRCAGVLAQHGKAEYAEALIRLKRCIEIGLLPSTIFHYSHLEDPTSVDITQFVLSHASDDVPLKQMAGVFKRFGYLSLASSVTELSGLAELIEDPEEQKSILQSLNSNIAAKHLHATYLIAEHDLATRHECGTLLCAISKKTFSMTVVSIQSTKTPNVMSKTADILEECESFPTAAKQLRVLVTVVKELHLTAAKRYRLRAVNDQGVDVFHFWMCSLAGVVATQPVEDIEKSVAIFKQYDEPILASRLKVLGSLVREQLLSKKECPLVADLAFDNIHTRKWEEYLLQMQGRKGKPTLVRTEEILQALPQSVP